MALSSKTPLAIGKVIHLNRIDKKNCFFLNKKKKKVKVCKFKI